MKQSKTLVIGGKGFIGEYLVKDLKDKGVEVEIFDTDSADTLETAVSYAVAVVYLVRPNIEFLRRTLDAVSRSQVRTFIYASTVLVYKGGEKMQNEEDAVSPATEEGKNKRLEEEIVMSFKEKSKDINTIIARFGNVYGGSKNKGIIGRIFDQVSQKSTIPITIAGDGEQVKDFVFVDDVARALANILTNDVKTDVVNISTGTGSTLLSVIDTIEKLVKTKIDYNFGPEVPEAGRLIADNSKLRSLIGWAPNTTLEQGLRKTAERCIINNLK